MPRFIVEVQKALVARGTLIVEADDEDAAQTKVDAMMADPKNPLQTTDPRIDWDRAEYDDGTFRTTGMVDEL